MWRSYFPTTRVVVGRMEHRGTLENLVGANGKMGNFLNQARRPCGIAKLRASQLDRAEQGWAITQYRMQNIWGDEHL